MLHRPPIRCRHRAAVRLIFATAALLLASASGAAAEDVSALAKRLASLRGEVESLSDELAARKNTAQDELRSYARQKSELTLEIQREQTRLQKLQQSLAQKKAEAAELKEANQDLLPAFKKHLETTRRYVRQSLPFRVKERLAELDKLEQQVTSGLISPPRGLNRLWSFVEDEMRMTKESGLFSQPVLIDGQEQLADVARLGMVMMYYRTPDEQYGSTVYADGTWEFRSIEDEAARKQIRALFESFKKQIRVGYFELPAGALPAPAK